MSANQTAKLPGQNFNVPESLNHLSVSREEYLRLDPKYQQLVVGALVFHGNRLLMVQRAATERAFPLVWEVPGGSCEFDDETVLHGVARELWEEVGLQITKFNHLVDEMEFSIPRLLGKDWWMKLTFDVDVAKIHAGRDSKGGEETNLSEVSSIPVKLDPVEHQSYLWVTEEQLAQGEAEGIKLNCMNERNKASLLKGFALRRQRAP